MAQPTAGALIAVRRPRRRSPALRQRLPHEKARSGRVAIEFGEAGIAQALVEPARLEFERVEPRAVAARSGDGDSLAVPFFALREKFCGDF